MGTGALGDVRVGCVRRSPCSCLCFRFYGDDEGAGLSPTHIHGELPDPELQARF